MKHGCWLILFGISLSLSSGCQSTSWKTAASPNPRKPAQSDAQANNANSSRRSSERGESVDDRYLGKTPQELMTDGGRLEREQKFSEAASVYKLVLRQDAQNGDAHHRLAILADLEKDYPTAETHYQKALAQKPANANILSDLGYSNYLRGNLKQAEQTLLQAIAADPQHIQAQNNLGQVYAEQGRYDDALATFRKVKPETEVQEVMAQLFPDRNFSSEMARNQPAWATDDPNDRAMPQSPMAKLSQKELAKLSPEQVKELMAQEREFSEQTRAARDRQMALQESAPKEIVTPPGNNWESTPTSPQTAQSAAIPPWERAAATNSAVNPAPANPAMDASSSNLPAFAQNGAPQGGSPRAMTSPSQGTSHAPEDQMPFWAGGGAKTAPSTPLLQQPALAQSNADQLPVIQPAGAALRSAPARATQPWPPAPPHQGGGVTQANNPSPGFDTGNASWGSEPTLSTNSSTQPPLQLAEATQDSWNSLNTTTPGPHPLLSNTPNMNGQTSAPGATSQLARAAQFGLQVGPGALFIAPGFGPSPSSYPAELNKAGNEYPQTPTYQVPPHGLSSNSSPNNGPGPAKVTPQSPSQNWASPWDQPSHAVEQAGGAVPPTVPNSRPSNRVVPAGAWSGNAPTQPGLNVNPFAEFRNKPAITPSAPSGQPGVPAQTPRGGQPQTIAWPPQSSANPTPPTATPEPAPWPHAPQR